MGRAPRIEFKGAAYHVFARGNRRERIFLDDKDYRAYVRDLRELAEAHGVEVLAYCLMPNHPHLCVRTHGTPLSVFMHRLNTRHARRFNRRHGMNGHLHEGRYRALLIENSTYLMRLVRYIHQNPVRAGLSRTALEWPYSSRAEYSTEHSWLVREAILGAFENTQEFEAFMDAAASPDDEALFRVAARGLRAVGTPGFAAKLAAAVEEQGDRKVLWMPLGQSRPIPDGAIGPEAQAWIQKHCPSLTVDDFQSIASAEPLRTLRRRLSAHLRSRNHSLRAIGLLLRRDLSTVSRFASLQSPSRLRGFRA